MNDSGAKKEGSGLCFTLEVSNKMGVHARPAAMIVRIASRYSGEVWVTKENERVNAKKYNGNHDVGRRQSARNWTSKPSARMPRS